MKLVEFLAAVKGRPRTAQVLSVMYWHERYDSLEAMTTTEIKTALVQSRVTGARSMNVADVMLKAGSVVDAAGNNEKGVRLWKLTETGLKEVRALHGLPDDEPEIAHGVSELRTVAAKINDSEIRAYVEEAILCLSVGALRAAIVYVWVAAVAEIETRTWASGARAVNAAVKKGNPNAKSLSKKDDLVLLKEVQLLQVAEDVGVLDKAQKMILDQALTTRNQSGHPNKYKPGVAKAKSHIEDIIGILWV